MNLYKVFLKHVFGAKYEGVKKNIFVIVIIFFAIYAAEIKMMIAPSVLFLTATVFTAGVMWQTLGVKSNRENLQGVLVLPFENRQLVLAYVFSISAYTMLSKSALILILFFAVGSWSATEILIALLCACNGCLFAVLGYLFCKKASGILVFLWLAGYIISIFSGISLSIFAGIACISFLIAVGLLITVDAFAFYHPGISKTRLRSKGKRGSFFVYLIRYLLSNKNYMVNTAGLCVIAGVLPIILKPLGDFNAMPIGLAILSLNTPLCILLSVDRDLEQAVRILPGQGVRFGAKYCVFLTMVNLLISSIYLVSWQLQFTNVGAQMFVLAMVFALQSALGSVVLEWLWPLRNWQLESDLYHHPRKYIVPGVMMLLAGLVSVWSGFVWVILGTLIMEILVIFFLGDKK